MVVSLLVEISQLSGTPWLESIRRSTLGGQVRGYDFVWSDLAYYAVGVGLGALVERVALCRRTAPGS